MKRRTRVILIFLRLLTVGGSIAYEEHQNKHTPYKVLASNDLGTVERTTYGCSTSAETIALITGIHPTEKISIDPEIQAAQEYVNEHSDVKVLHYNVNVVKDADDHDKGESNGEKLAHDYVIPDVKKSDANCVILSHSYTDGNGEGCYLATPQMDDASVEIAKKILATSDFGYRQNTGGEAYDSASAEQVPCPIAKAGYPTFVYEIPESMTGENSTNMAKDLFSQMVKYTS